MSRIKNSYVAVVALLLAVIVLGINLPASSAAAASQNVVLQPAADAYVHSSNPSSNYGTATNLRTDNVPVVKSYLRFDVKGLAGAQIVSAKLEIYQNSSSTKGLNLWSVANNTWGESSITYNNAPAMGAGLASTATVTGGSWAAFNVSSYVKSEGLYSFGLTTPGETNISLGSRESTNKPRLTLVVSTTSVPTATGVAPTATKLPPTATSVLPTATGAAPTATKLPPTATSVPPTATGAAPTATKLPPTATSVPPTATGLAPTATPISQAGDAVLVGAGDIASCSSSGDDATANLLDSIGGTVFTAGDNAYESGTSSEFANCYNPTWGRVKARTHPVPGNHEYVTSGASGYYGYFGAAAGDPSKGYYSYNLGAWHVVMLNSEINTATGSPQELWLRQDLAANPRACTLAIWHRPLYSSGSSHGSSPGMKPLWQALYDFHAELVINGHEHNYERFGPQNASSVADPKGLREFVVGTGGKSHYGFGTILPNSQVRNSDTYGVIKFTLHSGSYDWQFIPVAGQTFSDSGSAQCNP
ncbi:MAG TPA: DNRLRE domain-containing protein [Anaerolineales bacterium]|jgi:hypothetical protein